MLALSAQASGLVSDACDVAVVGSKNIEDRVCAGAHLWLRVRDIGNLELQRRVADAPAVVLELSAWRLEGLQLSADGEPLCIPELEPCAPADGHGLLTKQSLLEPRAAGLPREEWTWVLMLRWPEGAERLTVGWIDAWR